MALEISREQTDQRDAKTGKFVSGGDPGTTVSEVNQHYSPLVKAGIEILLRAERDAEELQGSEFYADLGNAINAAAIDLQQLVLTLKRADPEEIRAFREGQ